MVGMATLATIASRAVITGAFSLTQQAIQLGLRPGWRSAGPRRPRGTIYVPRINALLLVAVIVPSDVQVVERAVARLWHRRHGHDGGDSRAGLLCGLAVLALAAVGRGRARWLLSSSST